MMSHSISLGSVLILSLCVGLDGMAGYLGTAQGELTGFNTGNGEKLSISQAEQARHWATWLAVAKFLSISGIESCKLTP